MGDTDRRDDGRFSTAVTDSELLAAVRTHEPAATSEVAGEVDITRQGADKRLRQLRDDGQVNSKKIGASLVWFSVDDDADAGDSPLDSRGESHGDATETGNDTTTDGATDGVSLGDDVPERIDDADARDAVAAAVDYVAEHGPTGMREVVNAVLPEHPLGYDTDVVPLESGERYRGAWWRKVVKNGLEESGARYRNGVGWVVDGEGES